MEAMLRRMVEENGLDSIGVNLFTKATSAQFTVYVHWDGGCKGGNGDTIKEALDVALEQMRELRADREAA